MGELLKKADNLGQNPSINNLIGFCGILAKEIEKIKEQLENQEIKKEVIKIEDEVSAKPIKKKSKNV